MDLEWILNGSLKKDTEQDWVRLNHNITLSESISYLCCQQPDDNNNNNNNNNNQTTTNSTSMIGERREMRDECTETPEHGMNDMGSMERLRTRH